MKRQIGYVIEAIARGVALLIIMYLILKILAILYLVNTGELIQIISTLIKSIPGTIH